MKTSVPALAAGMLLLTGAVLAAESIVPIEEEPQHRLKFQNQHVRLFDALLPPGYKGQTLILDNERVRVTRIMIGPGERLSLHPPCGMLVSVSGGRVKLNAPGGEEQITLPPAGFKWRDQSSALEIVNAGSEVFHAVDIVVK